MRAEEPAYLGRVNRSAVVLIPKAPFLAWVQSVDPDPAITLETMREEPTVYLLPGAETDRAFEASLKRVFRTLFEEELNSWYTEPSLWPTPLTFSLFHSWFEVRRYLMVTDTTSRPLLREEDL